MIATERIAAVGEMSSRIAYELRNSLKVVGGLARRLHEKSTNNDLDRDYLRIIFEEVKAKEIYGNPLPATPFEIGVQEYNVDATTI